MKTLVAWDCETTLIAPLVQAPPLVALGFQIDGGKKHVVMGNDPACARVLTELLSDRSLLLAAHNCRFDYAVVMAYLAKLGREVEGAKLVFDHLANDNGTCTLLREQLLHIAVGAAPMKVRKWDLGTSCAKWKTRTQPNKSDEWRTLWGSLGHLHARALPADARKYLEEDLQAVTELYRAQEAYGAPRKWLLDQHRQTRASLALSLMQCWGFRTDPIAAERLYRQTVGELEAAAALCKQHGLIRPNGVRDTKAATARMIEVHAARGTEPKRNDPTDLMLASDENAAGGISLDEEACQISGDAILQAYSLASRSQTLLSKVARLRKPVIQSSFGTLVETGRTSCSQGKDPKPGQAPTSYGSQLQNPPKAVEVQCRECPGDACPKCEGKGVYETAGVRECFVPRPGNALFDIDYAAMELRTLAQIERWWFGESDLGDILNDPNRCPHIELGAEIRGIPREVAYAMKSPSHPDHRLLKKLRQLAKGPNFGAPGGMGAARLVEYCRVGYGIDLTETEAKRILALLKKIFRQRGPYLARAAEATKASKTGKFRFVHPYSLRARGGVGYSDGNNSPFQGLAADAAKEALWRVVVEMYSVETSPLFGARAVNFVHDQLLAEGPEARYREIAKRLEEVWCAGAQAVVPDILILAPLSVCRRWSKAFGDPYLVNGELEIWPDHFADAA